METNSDGKLTNKGKQIRTMFNTIAPRYDLLNRLLSLGIDRYWRKRAVSNLTIPTEALILDLATGTCDVALEIASQTPETVTIIGEDFTQGMLVLGKKKVEDAGLSNRIQLVNAPCESIPHPDNIFDGATISFGIRNVVDREEGLREICRVLKPSARLVVLEFSIPQNRFFNAIYHFYFKRLLPAIGGLVSKRSAYEYLPASVLEFPSRDEFASMMKRAGFASVTITDMTFGIVSLYVGTKE